LNINDIKLHCLSKNGSREDYPFGPEAMVIKVGAKMFALISENDNKIHVSLKCDPILTHSLRQEYTWVTPGYHLNKEHWNTLIIDDSTPQDKVFWMIDFSYELVYKKLTKAEKEKLL
jgi:predicted DNA-binding protein (MmcQ/YjbR family)